MDKQETMQSGYMTLMANIQQMPNTMELQELSRLLCLI